MFPKSGLRGADTGIDCGTLQQCHSSGFLWPPAQVEMFAWRGLQVWILISSRASVCPELCPRFWATDKHPSRRRHDQLARGWSRRSKVQMVDWILQNIHV
jgi:hypothetical protein